MFGIILAVIAALAIAFASYRMGSSSCETDAEIRDSQRNTALVVIVLGAMFLLCAMLSLLSGGGLPFNFVLGGGQAQKNAV